jgi:hypothetical protein
MASILKLSLRIATYGLVTPNVKSAVTIEARWIRNSQQAGHQRSNTNSTVTFDAIISNLVKSIQSFIIKLDSKQKQLIWQKHNAFFSLETANQASLVLKFSL